ncbi:hypothetical protein ETI09_03470 [Macrococcoides canis]|uniref:phage tail terminator protein n=1 Tax=Macrococcoides canis TaxID=1855823 RepID=UPI00105B9097|nr:minor capsid protein [Macrococcus canis]TDM43444.1 hypothetical protein ETI09_03470 [Macrococcus canis]
MIQESIMNLLRENIVGLTWSVDYRTLGDNTGTVYSDGGEKPGIYDDEMKYPHYQIYIRSSDFDRCKDIAYKAYALLHKKSDWLINEQNNVIHVYFIEAFSEPLRIGVEDNVMEYSINFRTTLRIEN